MESLLLDVAGHRRSPATMPGYHRGRPPRNKGEEYPADPPTVEEIVAVMRAVGDRPDGHRLRALIVLLWRAGLRISEALALQASVVRSGWTAEHGISSTRGLRSAASSRWAQCCVSVTAPPPADAGKRQPRASSCITRPPRLTSGAGSRRTIMPTSGLCRCV